MQSNNPVLSRAPQFTGGGYAGFDERGASRGPATGYGPSYSPSPQPSLEDMYAAPSATPVQTGRMTYDDVVVRTGLTLAVVLAGAAVGWFGDPLLWIVGGVAGLVLGLVNAFKREPSPVLIMAYAAAQGLFLGGISSLYEARFNGIVFQAVVATFATFGVMLALYRSGRIRATARFQKILSGAIMGYAIFCLINLGILLFTGAGIRGGFFGLVIGAIGAVLAALSFVLDFEFVQQGVRNGIPQRYAWTAAFGLVVTLIWLYIELLRILSILRSED
ncbi:Bax inhibitor-1/YccA family protein [Quadrisphaera sp. DSM 44207]|uniref:Bax inhibitor-1/YccA family protein n=1 Tax=Quadrisphaera sp. DSM 44207 TaxID=1881057 RepID=UPI0008885C1C|nr:Bax inhibitor-1/YccA family protein [Quadrisphaera sp. DSM 44207]SDQ68999.1 Uncharacterized membrane protein, YccA/Bax inhibitor family [Quadrisphaera sp. DSM 44207]